MTIGKHYRYDARLSIRSIAMVAACVAMSVSCASDESDSAARATPSTAECEGFNKKDWCDNAQGDAARAAWFDTISGMSQPNMSLDDRIELANETCDEIARLGSVDALHRALAESLQGNPQGLADAKDFVDVSITTYCREYEGQL